MSTFLCFICHSTVNTDTREETREKYRDVVGMHLCPDSHLCHICCHVLNKLWLFKSVCLKRSLEYPVLFSEKGTINLQRNDLEIHTVCPEGSCGEFHNRNINSKSYNINFHGDSYDHSQEYKDNKYVELEDDRNDFDDYREEIYNDNGDFKHTSNIKELYEYTNHEHNNTENDRVNETNDNHLANNNNDHSNQTNDNTEANIDNDHSNETNDFVIANNTDVKEENVDDETDKNVVDNNHVHSNDDYDDSLHDTPKSDPNEFISTDMPKTENKKSKKCKIGFEKTVLSLEEQKAELEARRKEKKYLESVFKCYNCALGFLFKDSYQTHMMRHEESNGEYRCAACSLRFASARVLSSHRASHAERYRCVRCGCCVPGPRQRRAHALRCGGRKEAVACQLCARMFEDLGGLQQHIKRFHRSKTSSRSYTCGVCGKSFTNQAAVRTHMITHVNKKFDCDKCPSTFSSPYTLAHHKKKHGAAVEHHYCSTCGVGYTSRKSLLAHLRNALNHQQTVYECPICSRNCANQRSLASHMETVHSTTKNYSCETCGARYSSRKSLVRHEGSHGPRPVPRLAICHLCGASFKGTNKLNRHLREVCEKAKLEEEFANLYDQELMNAH